MKNVINKFFGATCAILVVLLPRADAGDAQTYAERIAPLIDPAKLATLGERGANPRVQKYVAQLAEAKQSGIEVSNVVVQAVALVSMKGEAAKLTTAAMLRNLTIAEQLGCLDKAGLGDMRRGQSPTIRRGPYKGDELSVDHIIPRAVAPELDNVIANLELMPFRMNAGKRDKIGERQKSLAKQFHAAGLLSQKGFKAVEKAVPNSRR
jgi:hypothetical protein